MFSVYEQEGADMESRQNLGRETCW